MSFHFEIAARPRDAVRPRLSIMVVLAVVAVVIALTAPSNSVTPSALADTGTTVGVVSHGTSDAGGTAGLTQTVNPGTPGQCTWGAAQKWFEASGSYPAMRGDAMFWADSARAAGWTVVDDARERSIVVFPPGVAGAGSIGHVAWVDSVSQRLDGRWIHVTEMNNLSMGGPGIFNGRDVKQVPGMSYVLLP